MSTEQIEQVRKFIKEHKPDLSISRVPPKTLEIFKRFADENFCSDYGMALKALIDNQIIFNNIFSAIDELMSRVSKLEEKQKLPKELKMLDGSIKKTGKGE